MKRSAILLGLVLTAAPLAAGWADGAHASPYFGADQHRKRYERDEDKDRRQPPPQLQRPRYDDDGSRRPPQRSYGPAQDQGENRRDDRINRAIAAGQARGRVLDAGQQGGSTFWVRVDTGHGRVDLLVDGDTGRIVGER